MCNITSINIYYDRCFKGKTIKEAKDIIQTFIDMIKRETKSEEELKN